VYETAEPSLQSRDKDKLDAESPDWLQELLLNATKMGALIHALLTLARVTVWQPFSGSCIVTGAAAGPRDASMAVQRFRSPCLQGRDRGKMSKLILLVEGNASDEKPTLRAAATRRARERAPFPDMSHLCVS